MIVSCTCRTSSGSLTEENSLRLTSPFTCNVGPTVCSCLVDNQVETQCMHVSDSARAASAAHLDVAVNPVPLPRERHLQIEHCKFLVAFPHCLICLHRHALLYTSGCRMQTWEPGSGCPSCMRSEWRSRHTSPVRVTSCVMAALPSAASRPVACIGVSRAVSRSRLHCTLSRSSQCLRCPGPVEHLVALQRALRTVLPRAWAHACSMQCPAKLHVQSQRVPAPAVDVRAVVPLFDVPARVSLVPKRHRRASRLTSARQLQLLSRPRPHHPLCACLHGSSAATVCL